MVPYEVVEALPEPAHPAAEAALNGYRVLVVDDNETNRLILARQLKSWGIVPELACSGLQALEKLRTNSAYHLAILDLQMPEMDGLSLAQEIRQLALEQPLPLVMLTSIGQRLDREEANGLAACLTKPVKPAQLRQVLAAVLCDETPLPPLSGVREDNEDKDFARRYPQRILLAEDNLVNQKVALRMLAKLGYSADVATNGVEVLAALERKLYNLILMDVQMPEMDGIEATVRIRAQKKDGQHRLRIVAMTAYAYKTDLDRCLAVGMDGFITKPIRLDALKAVMKPLVGGVTPTPALPPMNGQDPQELVDESRMQDLADSLGDGLQDVIDSYLEDTPHLIKEIEAAYQRADWAEVQRIAHSLKSSSGIFGAQALVESCRALEIAARNGPLASPEPIRTISLAYAKVRDVLNLYMSSI